MKFITPNFYDDPFELYDLLNAITNGEEVMYRNAECVVTSLPALTSNEKDHFRIWRPCELMKHRKAIDTVACIRQTTFFNKLYNVDMVDETFLIKLFLDNGKAIKLQIHFQDEPARKYAAVIFDDLSDQNKDSWIKHNATTKFKQLRMF